MNRLESIPVAGDRLRRQIQSKAGALREAIRALGDGKRKAVLKANVLEALVSLGVNRQRTALALVGISLGVAAVTAMVSVGVTAKAESLKRLKDLGTDTLVARKYAPPSARQRARADIKLRDVAALPLETETVAAVAPGLQVFGPFSYAGRSFGNKSIVGVTGAAADVNKLAVAEGRFVSDLDAHRHYCVVGHDIAESMRAGGGAKRLVGERLAMAGRICTVVGVLADTPASALRPFRANDSMLLPLTTARRVFQQEIQFVVARATPDADHHAAASEIRAHFQRRAPGLRVRVRTADHFIALLQKQMRMFALLLAAIGGISLVIGGTAVMNVMLSSVAERRREIGVRRALGARRRDIRNQFLIESLALSLAGGALGIVVGVGAAFAICLYADWSFLASPLAMFAGFGVATGVGLFFGAHPAHRAAQLDPIVALRAT